MAAPSIAWYRLSGTTSAPTYSAITSLNFGTVTAGMWSKAQCVRPKISTNSITSAKWWLYDVAASRSSASVGIGTAGGWIHRMDITQTYVKASTLAVSAAWGHESPQSTTSALSYSSVAPAAYGDFVYFAVRPASAAGDGAHTAWGYQLKYSYS